MSKATLERHLFNAAMQTGDFTKRDESNVYYFTGKTAPEDKQEIDVFSSGSDGSDLEILPGQLPEYIGYVRAQQTAYAAKWSNPITWFTGLAAAITSLFTTLKRHVQQEVVAMGVLMEMRALSQESGLDKASFKFSDEAVKFAKFKLGMKQEAESPSFETILAVFEDMSAARRVGLLPLLTFGYAKKADKEVLEVVKGIKAKFEDFNPKAKATGSSWTSLFGDLVGGGEPSTTTSPEKPTVAPGDSWLFRRGWLGKKPAEQPAGESARPGDGESTPTAGKA